ncbi:MAG: hypothetical protein ACJ72N_07440 [Labedaea sp.]|jgi:hypothetical protein
MTDPTESEVRAALEAYERAIRTDPQLAVLMNLGRKCPACGSTDVEAIPGGRMRRCRHCHLIWLS